MEKPGFVLLLMCLALPALGQSRPVIPATVVVETKELMALQDSVRWNRMARREAEKQRDSLWVLLQTKSPVDTPAPPAEVAPTPPVVPTPATPQETPAAETPRSSVFWIVVGGSPNREEADRMVSAYSLAPFQAQSVTAPNGIHRVCWGPFSDEKTALDVLREARKVRPDAWFWRQD